MSDDKLKSKAGEELKAKAGEELKAKAGEELKAKAGEELKAKAGEAKETFIIEKIQLGALEKDHYSSITFPLEQPVEFNGVLIKELTVKPLTGFHIMSVDDEQSASQKEFSVISKLIGLDEEFLTQLSGYDLQRLLKVHDFYYLSLKKFSGVRALFLREAWQEQASEIYTNYLSAKS